MALKQANTEDFRSYQKQVVANCSALSKKMQARTGSTPFPMPQGDSASSSDTFLLAAILLDPLLLIVSIDRR